MDPLSKICEYVLWGATNTAIAISVSHLCSSIRCLLVVVVVVMVLLILCALLCCVKRVYIYVNLSQWQFKWLCRDTDLLVLLDASLFEFDAITFLCHIFSTIGCAMDVRVRALERVRLNASKIQVRLMQISQMLR